MPKPIIIICGPTASGKTKLSLSIARQCEAVIINADSMQCYKEIPIITAQPVPTEQEMVPHRLFGVLSVTKPCSVARWIELARVEIGAAHEQDRIPILVGGTGMYLSSLINGLSPIPDIKKATKQHSKAVLATKGKEALYDDIIKADADAAVTLNKNDTQRILRAYSILYQTGKPLSYWYNQRKTIFYDKACFKSYFVNPHRETLYQRCNQRFDLMLEMGLMDEMEYIHSMQLSDELTAMKALGLKELLAFLDHKLSFEVAVTQAKTATRRYAKRQITWFRHQMQHHKVIRDPHLFDITTLWKDS